MHIVDKLMLFIVLACFGIGMFFLILLFWPVTIIKTNVQPYKILTPVVKMGGSLIYQVDACKYTDLQGTVTRTFEDGSSYPSIISAGYVKLGCAKTNVTIHVPNYIPPGKYRLILDISYQVNPIRIQYYQFTTDNFTIENN